MEASMRRVRWTTIVAFLSAFSFACVLNTALAAEPQKETKTKSVVKTKTTTKAKTAKTTTKVKTTKKVKAQQAASVVASPAAVIISEDVALAAFDAFTVEWMQKLTETEDFRKSRAQIKQSLDGFSAEYTGYLPQRFINVKKTESTDTPYVGILTYYEKTLRCTGKTKEEALKGPFDQVDTSQVSEIFRFTKGKWVY